MLGRDLEDGIDAEAIELERGVAGPLVVDLVHGKQHGPPGFVQLAGNRLVAANQAFTAVADEHQQIGPLDGALSLDDDQFVQRILACAV